MLKYVDHFVAHFVLSSAVKEF